jgi:hypothetical protein
VRRSEKSGIAPEASQTLFVNRVLPTPSPGIFRMMAKNAKPRERLLGEACHAGVMLFSWWIQSSEVS